MITITIEAALAASALSALIVYNIASFRIGLLAEKIAKLQSETRHLSDERFRLISEIDRISREHLSEKLRLIDEYSKEIDRHLSEKLRLIDEHAKEIDRIIGCLTDKK